MASTKRQCPRCGTLNPKRNDRCSSCGTWIKPKFWRMNKARKAAVHALATKKGLIIGRDRDLYDLRLSSMGLTSCLDMKKPDFKQFMTEVGRLPDAT